LGINKKYSGVNEASDIGSPKSHTNVADAQREAEIQEELQGSLLRGWPQPWT
jgi:hypothetical protein